MGKLYAERLIKAGEDESLIPSETFILRFKKDEFDSLKLKSPFKVLLHQDQPMTDVDPIAKGVAEEGIIIATQNSDGDTIDGIFKEDNAIQYKSDDYEFRKYYSEENEVTSIPDDELTAITSAGLGDKPVASGTDVSFSISTVNKTADALQGITWSIKDGQGKDTMTDVTEASFGKDNITLNFPKSGADAIQQYTIVVTSASGKTKEKKVIIGLSDDQLTSVPVTDKKDISRPKEIKIDKGIHSGSTVAMAPVTFSVKSWKGTKKSQNTNRDLVSWIVYKGGSTDNPILFKQSVGTTCTIDFTTLPEGDYTVEALGQYSDWHVKKGLNIYGEQFKPLSGEVFKPMKVTSAKNIAESIKTDALVQNTKNKKQETNWGVPVRFNADLLFDDSVDDVSKLQWELKDAEGNIVMKDDTDKAQGTSHVDFTFPQPEKATDYTLTLTLNGVSKSKTFTVVPKAFAKTIAMETNVKDKRVVYDEEKQLTFKVTGYTQLQANTDDPKNVKWIRIFFPGLKRSDYSNSIKLTFVGDYPVGAYMTGHTGIIDHYENVGDTLTVEAGREDPVRKKDAYWKGLYIVEAYTGKPDGKATSDFHDMEYYEVISNEPHSIEQVKTDLIGENHELTDHGFMRTYGTNNSQYYKFKVNSWLFEQSLVESKNVRWGLFKNENDLTPLVPFTQTGPEVNIRTGNAGNYYLKAWIDDVILAASLPVTIEDPKILNAFFADSSGKRISKCGIGDKVYLYFETTGLQQEMVQVNIFDSDYWSDDNLISGFRATPNDEGVIFQEFTITEALVNKNESTTTHSQLYLTMSLDLDSPVVLPNQHFDRTMRHYFINNTMILDVYNEQAAVDFNFVDDTDNLVLNTPVLYGDKVKVRVRLTNQKDKEVYIYLFDVGAKSGVALPESKTPVKVNEEGFAEMEFTVPKDWEKSHTGKDTDSRIFVPYISYDQKTVTVIDNSTDATKALHVVKTMPSQTEIDALNLRNGVELAKLPVPKKAANDKVPSSINLAWGNKVDEVFALKVMEVSQRVQCDPNDLMAVMAVESFKTFRTYQIEGQTPDSNPKQSDVTQDQLNGHAVGLIQFTPDAINGLNSYLNTSYTKYDLSQMEAVEQLELVARYIQMWREGNKISGPLTIGDLYVIVFAPSKLVGGNDDTVLYPVGSKGYKANESVDTDKNDPNNKGITKKEIAARAYAMLAEGQQSKNSKNYDLTSIKGDEHVYKVDISSQKIEKTNDPGTDKLNYIYYVYDGASLLGYHIMVKNSFDLVDFPVGGPNWGRFGTRDSGGDNFADEKAAAAALGFFYSLPGAGFTDTLLYNDISAFDKRDIGHSTHKTGCDFDIRYPGLNIGQKFWNEARDNYGSDAAFFAVLEIVLKVATDWGFTNNYTWDKNFKYTRHDASNAVYAEHDNHFHIGYKK